MPRDLLANRPALPTTIIPGYHVIPLPLGSTQIHIRRYRSTQGDSTPGETLLSRLRDDPLERGWKAINGEGRGEGEGDELSDSLLEQGCGTVVNVEKGGEDQQNQRQFWVFFVGHAPVASDSLKRLDLEEIIPPLPDLDPAQLITCLHHGHDLSCLRTGSTCDIAWTAQGETTKHWDILRDALVEKKSWTFGQRIFTRPGQYALLKSSEITAKLYPLTANKLLLTVKPNPLPRCMTSISTPHPKSRHLRPLVLRPLGLPALMIGPYTPSTTQESQLNSLFESTLGSTWNACLPGRRLDAQITQQPLISWSVLWTPLSFEKHERDISNMSPLELAKEMQKGQGVITIWPHHLIHDLCAPISPSSSTSASTYNRHEMQLPTIAAAHSVPIPSFPTPSDLMNTASGLFDFLSSYQPQPSPQATPEADEDADGQMDEDPEFEPTITASSQASVRAPSPEGSDIDDLFSAHSPSPTLDPIPLSRLPSPTPEDTYESQSDTFVLDQDVVMSSPTPPVEDEESTINGGNANGGGALDGTGGEAEVNLVTEDDFDFFDSPMTPKVDGMGEGDESEFNEGKTGGMSNSPVEEAVAVPSISPTVVSARDSEIPLLPDGRESTSPEQHIIPSNQSQPNDTSPLDLTPHPKAKKTVSFDPAAVGQTPPNPANPESALVPSPFAPIDIDNTSLPTFAYALPSPAPTPESLRPELVERLQSHTQRNTTTPDYASLWDFESESSEMDEDDDYSGAPPTPVSVSDTDIQTSVIPSPNEIDGHIDVTEILWENTACVGSEWVALIHGQKAAEGLGKPWNSVWNDGTDKLDKSAAVPPPTPPHEQDAEKKSALDDGVCDRLVQEVISNRFLRESLLLASADGSEHAITLHDSDVSKGGVNLLNFTHGDDMIEDETHGLTQLDACRIHTGFSGNITEISIAALRYWRQLGLQPGGGPKDITAFVVCEMDDGVVRAVSEFLDRMGQTYEASQLGKHQVGDATPAKNGIIAIPSVGFVNSITVLLSNAPQNTVVYVVLPSAPPSALATITKSILSIPTSSDPFHFVKLIPPFALQARQTQSIAFEVYEHLPRTIRSISLRGVRLESPVEHVQYPYFTLSPNKPPTPELTLAWPLRSYDVMNKWRWIHLAYGFDQTRKRAVAFVVDAEGEMWATKSWAVHKGWMDSIIDIWSFGTATASTVGIEYRLAICSLGLMSVEEIEAWRKIINPKIPVTLLMADLSAAQPPSTPARPNITTIPPSIFADPTTRMVDETLAGRMAPFPRLPIEIMSYITTSTVEQNNPKEEDKDKEGNPDAKPTTQSSATRTTTTTTQIYPSQSFLLNLATASGKHTSSTYHILSHRSPPQRDDEDVLKILAGDYHRLYALGRMRFGMEDASGPVHLEGVRIALKGIEKISELA